MTSERCMHELLTDECGECRPAPPGLAKRVVTTRGGQVFHRIATCQALREGQRYAERRGDEIHQPTTVALAEAQSEGRAPCSVCFPDYCPGVSDQVPDPLRHMSATLDAARRSVSAAVAAGVDRRRLTDLVARAMLDIRSQVWPEAAPARLPER